MANSRSVEEKDKEPELSFWVRKQGNAQRVMGIMSKEHVHWPKGISTGIWVNLSTKGTMTTMDYCIVIKRK